METSRPRALAALSALVLAAALPAAAQTVFHDAAGSLGVDYRRTPSPAREAALEALRQLPAFTMQHMAATPLKPGGAPGVALVDVDVDGDLDVYVTNGPGADNPLYLNLLAETGAFALQRTVSGAEATAQDSSGVCFGDVDNDGDPDLYVLGTEEPNRFFVNRGNGTFDDRTAASGLGGGALGSSSCSLGDVDNDGLLDVVVANTWSDWTNMEPIFLVPFARSQHNQLFLNRGGNVFEEVAAEAGLHDQRGFSPAGLDGSPTITWAIALVDLDLDGDVDLVTADDQGAIPEAALGGMDRGLIHVFENDGAGRFTDVTDAAGTGLPGGWMGLSFGDLDADGSLDLFATNVGAYLQPKMGMPVHVPELNSRWFFGTPGGAFVDSRSGGLEATPFGWGTSMADFDNDGDTDVVFFGGLDAGVWVDASNPGVLLVNDGAGNLAYEPDGFLTDYRRHIVHGSAAGDLDRDGFVDVVTVSAFDAPPPAPVVSYGLSYGSPFDAEAALLPTFAPNAAGEMVFTGLRYAEGSVQVQLNAAGGPGSVAVRTVGSAGLLARGAVNRDGIGAVVGFDPRPGRRVMRPVVGGASYASQDDLEGVFGLGGARRGTVEVLWPGGVRNRLYGVEAGERIVFPEIPCSYDVPWPIEDYQRCLRRSLDGLEAAGVLSAAEAARFRRGAVSAYFSVPGR